MTTTEFWSEFMGRDAERFLVYRSHDGGFVMDFRVTECCRASAKGCSFGVGCRKCYQPVDDRIGGEPRPPYTRDGTVTYEAGKVPAGWEVFHR